MQEIEDGGHNPRGCAGQIERASQLAVDLGEGPRRVLGPLSGGDVFDGAFPRHDPPRRVTDRAGAVADPDDRAVRASKLLLEVARDAVALEPVPPAPAIFDVDVEGLGVRGEQALAVRIAEDLHVGRVGV